LLFDVTALLITSATLGPVAEAFVVPENTSIVVLSSAPSGALPPLGPVNDGVIDTAQNGTLIDPSAVDHPIRLSTFAVSQTSTAELKSLSGVPLLRDLAMLPRTKIASFLSENPKVVSGLLASPPSAREVTSLWQSLTASQRTTMRTAAPRLVGNLDGIPANVRNLANRAWIKSSRASMTADLNKITGRAQSQDAKHQLHMIDEVQDALGSSKSVPARSLLSVDPSGQGKAAIVIGNLQTADYVTYMVPGMFFTVDGQIDDWTDDASRLYDEQVSWLDLLNKNSPGQPKKTVAVVAWMGYQTPDLTNIGSLDLAYQGRDALAHALEGMQADRAGNEPYTTIVAHSYGSTAALMALTEYNFKVDALVLVGSPGSAAQSVDDLHVRKHNVWVGSAAWDPVPNSAWFGSDPASPSYGAKTMAVGGGIDQITDEILAPSFGHNEYFGAGTESMRNMALVGIDHGELVTNGTSADKTKTLALER
jgi:hypothetical protein